METSDAPLSPWAAVVETATMAKEVSPSSAEQAAAEVREANDCPRATAPRAQRTPAGDSAQVPIGATRVA